jgi:branched-subunit amino acid aminotransferase/4-amino-4-deoxychorismate lyase
LTHISAKDRSSFFDILLYNERDELTECTIANIAVQALPGWTVEGLGDKLNPGSTKKVWATPAAHCGAMPSEADC